MKDMNADPTIHADDELLRNYAAGKLTWRFLRANGFDSYLDVLGGLGDLGLKPPMAAMEGPNMEARRRARAVLARVLRDTSPTP